MPLGEQDRVRIPEVLERRNHESTQICYSNFKSRRWLQNSLFVYQQNCLFPIVWQLRQILLHIWTSNNHFIEHVSIFRTVWSTRRLHRPFMTMLTRNIRTWNDSTYYFFLTLFMYMYISSPTCYFPILTPQYVHSM